MTNINATEIEAFANNDSRVYSQLVSCYKNLQRKMKKGTYDRELAVKLFTYPATEAAKLYHKEYCGSGIWHNMFSVEDRREAAIMMRDNFECEINAGNGWL